MYAVLSAIRAMQGLDLIPVSFPKQHGCIRPARTIHEDGAEQFLINMLQMLRESFEHAHLQFGEAEDE